MLFGQDPGTSKGAQDTQQGVPQDMLLVESVNGIFRAVGTNPDAESRGVRLGVGDVLTFGEHIAMSAQTSGTAARPIKWAAFNTEDGRLIGVNNIIRKGNGLSFEGKTNSQRAVEFIKTVQQSPITLQVVNIRETVYRNTDGTTSTGRQILWGQVQESQA